MKTSKWPVSRSTAETIIGRSPQDVSEAAYLCREQDIRLEELRNKNKGWTLAIVIAMGIFILKILKEL